MMTANRASAQRGHHHRHFGTLTFGALLMSVVGPRQDSNLRPAD
jgi:hypothetical protein